VTEVRVGDGAVLGTFSAGTQASGVVFDGLDIWVSCAGSVVRLQASTGAPVATYTVGGGPYGISFDGASVWVANTQLGTVSKL
jgi:DNA-binding beta-propeller fold protein YncE